MYHIVWYQGVLESIIPKGSERPRPVLNFNASEGAKTLCRKFSPAKGVHIVPRGKRIEK